MKVQMNVDGLNSVHNAIRGAAADIGRAQMRAVNQAASKARTAGSKAIREDVRLSAKYVNKNLTLSEKATLRKPQAVISGRKRHTRLARYGAKQLTRKAPSGSSGDATRGIAAGRKQAGVSVAVRKGGSRKKMRKAFLLPLRNTASMGVFVRTGSGASGLKHLYGPSVHQVFTDVREDIAPQAQQDMAREYKRQMQRALARRRRR